MADSVNLLMVKLESAMLTQLLNSSSGQSSTDGTGLSFEDMLDGAMGGTSSAGLSAADPTAVGLSGVFGSSFENTAGPSQAAGSMTASSNLVQFIENHEGFASTAYRGLDNWNETIGYGHVITPGENLSGAALTQGQAQDLLKSDLSTYENSVNKEFQGVNLSQNQFDALVSFSYSLGANIWSKTPQLVADVKAGASPDAIKADFEKCDHVGGKVSQGLLNRRDDEAQLYSYGTYAS